VSEKKIYIYILYFIFAYKVPRTSRVILHEISYIYCCLFIDEYF